MTPLRCLLVDDEMLARLALRQALEKHADITVVGECGNAEEAILAVDRLHPDLVFLDIHMPGMDGLELASRLPAGALPWIVFATAYDSHALRAFDAGAIDYVLKPIDQDRFDHCIARLLQRWRQMEAPPTRFHALATAARRMSVRVGEHHRVIRIADIDYACAEGNYVALHVGGESILHRESMKNLELELGPQQFLRIHRRTLVNVDRVREVHPLFHGDAEIVLRDGTRLTLSRRFRDAAKPVLGLR